MLLLYSYGDPARAADVGGDETKTRLEDLDAKQFQFDSPYVIRLPNNYQLEAETGEGRKFSKGSYDSFTFGIGPYKGRSDKSRYHAHLDITVTLVEGQPELEEETSIADELAEVKRSTSSDKFESEPIKQEKVNNIEFTVASYNRSDHRGNEKTFERGFLMRGIDGKNRIFISGAVMDDKPVAAKDKNLVGFTRAVHSFRRKNEKTDKTPE